MKTLLRDNRIEEGVMANETTAATPQSARERGARQELVGVVTSAKMQKTIVVKVTRTTQHPLYHRVMRSAKKYYAHDETGEARVGDTVRIVSTRPLSKLKRWRLKEVLRVRRACVSSRPERLREHDNGSDEDMADGGR